MKFALLYTVMTALNARTLGQETEQAQETCVEACAQRALSFAYMYGLPLWAFGEFSTAYPNASTNTIYHQRELAKPGDLSVVRPNADTLYSALFIDISSSDLVLTVPELDRDRYVAFSFYNPYGDNVANIGTTLNQPPGDYVVRFDPNKYGVQQDAIQGEYQGYVNMPSPYGILLIRTMAINNERDIKEARKVQDKFKVTERVRFGDPLAPALNLSIFQDPYYMPTPNVTSLQESVMRLTAILAPDNEPVVRGDRAWVAEVLKDAGVADGNFALPAGTNLSTAAAQANESVTALLNTPGILLPMGNNWTIRNERLIGNYHSFYTMRYLIGIRGYLAMTTDQAIYPSLNPDFSLKEGQAALFHFSAKPKIRKGGFWSLTAYGPDHYLIPNDLNRYAIGDRSNMTFPDGTPLSDEDTDGPFQVLLQPADIEPPFNWTSNWLPVAPGGNTVSLTLRWYGAEPAMVDGSYVYPTYTIIDALRQ